MTLSITRVDKIDGIIFITKDGHEIGRTHTYKDTVISVPPDGFKKVTNIYYDPDTGKLVVVYKS